MTLALKKIQVSSVRGITNLDELVEEIRDIYVEHEFNAHWEILEAHHLVGQLICQKVEETGVKINELTASLAPRLGRSERTLWYAIAFYRKYPNINILPEGKNITWNQIITKYLTSPPDRANTECIHEPQLICRKCRAVLTEKV